MKTSFPAANAGPVTDTGARSRFRNHGYRVCGL